MQDWLKWVMYLVDLGLAIGTFTTLIFLARRNFANKIAHSKKHPYGQLVAEFWPETGRREYVLLPVEANGMEVRAPVGHKCPRYFFNKQATNTTKYPMDSFFRTLGISVDAPIVSWPLNCPEPISPYNMKDPIVNSEMLGNLQNDEFLGMGMVATRELAASEEELRKANRDRIPKGHFYMICGVAAFFGLVAAGASVMAYMTITKLAQGWGL
jgi:hypothetical protein